MSVINTEIKPFKASAFKNGEFFDLTEADVKGKWAVFFFYPADFTFVCPTELGDVADYYDELQKMGVEVYSVSTDRFTGNEAGQVTTLHASEVEIAHENGSPSSRTKTSFKKIDKKFSNPICNRRT